jgi:hypothetical protein
MNFTISQIFREKGNREISLTQSEQANTEGLKVETLDLM